MYQGHHHHHHCHHTNRCSCGYCYGCGRYIAGYNPYVSPYRPTWPSTPWYNGGMYSNGQTYIMNCSQKSSVSSSHSH